MNVTNFSDSFSSSQAGSSNKLRTLAFAVSSALLSLSLMACGGGSDNNTKAHTNTGGTSHNNSGGSQSNGNQGNQGSDGSTGEATVNAFTQKATWTVDGSKPGSTCYDFDAKKETECKGNKWDVKFDNQSRSVKLWTNSGISGEGKGAAFYLMPWTELAALKNAQQVPTVGYKADSATSVFTKNNLPTWAAYNVFGDHQMSPNNKVYLITTDSSNASIQGTAMNPVYAMQIISYYDESKLKNEQAGHPTIRWIDTAMPKQVHTKRFDASSETKWTYVNLKTGETVAKDGDWQIGLNRYNVILNSGASGTGNVGAYLAKTPAGYYETDANGKYKTDNNGNLIPIKAKFKQDNIQESLADLTNIADYKEVKDSETWVTDAASSQLNIEPTGTPPEPMDFGWYTYNVITHKLTAKPADKAIGSIIRSGEGNSYARMHLADIKYPENQWVFEFDVQPASNKE